MRDGAKRFLRTAGLLARPRSGSQVRLSKDASSLKCEIDAGARRNSFDGVEAGSRRPYLRSMAARLRYSDAPTSSPGKHGSLRDHRDCCRIAFRSRSLSSDRQHRPRNSLRIVVDSGIGWAYMASIDGVAASGGRHRPLPSTSWPHGPRDRDWPVVLWRLASSDAAL